jgi:hypothetical protein
MLHSTLAFSLAFAAAAAASPINVSLSGNFGPSLNEPTLFDNQNYWITFTIPEPHSPTSRYITGDGQAVAGYGVRRDMPGVVSVPGIGLSVTDAVVVEYVNQAPEGQRMNMSVTVPLPVSNVLCMTRFQTANGEPLWNGLAGSLGLPEIYPLDAVQGTARFFLYSYQAEPGGFSYPMGVYEMAATMTASAAVPEPSVILLAAAGLLVFSLRSRLSRRFSNKERRAAPVFTITSQHSDARIRRNGVYAAMNWT